MSIQVMIMMFLSKPNSRKAERPGFFAILVFTGLLGQGLLFPGSCSGQVDPYLAGRACMIKGQNDSAAVLLAEALSLRPGDTDILFYLGRARFAAGDFPGAREAFYEADKRQKSMASFFLAKTEVRLNRPEQALKYLKEHLESRYRLPEKDILLDRDLSTLEGTVGWNRLWNENEWYSEKDMEFKEALFMKENGEELEAINKLNNLEKSGYNRSAVQLEKALLYNSLGNRKAARTALESSIKSDVRNLDALEELIRLETGEGNTEEALKGLDRLIRQDKARFDAYLQRAVLRGKGGNLKGAMEDMELYLIYFPDDDLAYYRKGMIQFEQERYLDAIESFNRALRLDRGKAEYYFARGRTYARTGTTRYAEKDMSMALDLDPLNGEIWLEKGKLSESLGKKSTACHCYQKAYQYGIREAGRLMERNCR